MPHAVEHLYLTDPIPDFGRIDGIMFSGGVGEYVYGRESRDFGDMGRRLGRAIRARVDAGALPWPLLPAGECIRATALGASEYSVQLSGNTSYIRKPGELLPRRNLQVLQPPYECGEVIDADDAREGDPQPLHRLRPDRGREREVALALRWHGVPSYERIAAFAEGIRHGLANTIERKQAALHHARRRHRADARRHPARGTAWSRAKSWPSTACVLRDFDYIDLGRIRMPSYTVPVTIKSLVFSEDPRGRAAAPAHPSSRRRSRSRTAMRTAS